jgi:hypothetical protein
MPEPGIASVRPTEGTSDAASRHGHKSKETPYFQRTDIIKDKIPALIKDKFSLQMPSLPLIRKNDIPGPGRSLITPQLCMLSALP